MIPERLAQARSFGCETIDLKKGELVDQLAQLLGEPLVDAAVDCVGFEARGHGADAGEAPATVLNDVMTVARAGASIGIPARCVARAGRVVCRHWRNRQCGLARSDVLGRRG
jgi:glutathione-independent formaldehyde dehydrogenase